MPAYILEGRVPNADSRPPYTLTGNHLEVASTKLGFAQILIAATGTSRGRPKGFHREPVLRLHKDLGAGRVDGRDTALFRELLLNEEKIKQGDRPAELVATLAAWDEVCGKAPPSPLRKKLTFVNAEGLGARVALDGLQVIVYGGAEGEIADRFGADSPAQDAADEHGLEYYAYGYDTGLTVEGLAVLRSQQIRAVLGRVAGDGSFEPVETIPLAVGPRSFKPI